MGQASSETTCVSKQQFASVKKCSAFVPARQDTPDRERKHYIFEYLLAAFILSLAKYCFLW